MNANEPNDPDAEQIDPDLARANALRLDHRLREILDVEAQSREELNEAIGVWAQGKADEISEIAQMLDGDEYEEEARDLRQAEGLLRNVAAKRTASQRAPKRPRQRRPARLRQRKPVSC